MEDATKAIKALRDSGLSLSEDWERVICCLHAGSLLQSKKFADVAKILDASSTEAGSINKMATSAGPASTLPLRHACLNRRTLLCFAVGLLSSPTTTDGKDNVESSLIESNYLAKAWSSMPGAVDDVVQPVLLLLAFCKCDDSEASKKGGTWWGHILHKTDL